ncbi:helix-turn-helix domain-containing protein [Yokenella regensburgei]|uniref:helix-turn-helix domain-containing protein n=1 Tax=Yokenella regensburgei TaxID=158877 RepID=UPI001432DA70|nr:LysR family transcriptional regulator [Yokenella regensburgei]QIU88437.1 LysR family transcriptional regulator [Yokenella regensburgei]
MFTRQIHQFIALAKAGSFIQAAHDISLTPSALSHGIRDLEKQLGKKLIIRTKLGSSLTKAGVHFYNEVLPLYEKGLEVLKTTKRNNKKITISIDGFYYGIWSDKLQNLLNKYGDGIEICCNEASDKFECLINESCDIILSTFNNISPLPTTEVTKICLPMNETGFIVSSAVKGKYKNNMQILKGEVIFQRASILSLPEFNKLNELLIKNSIKCTFIGLPDFADVCGAVAMGFGVSLTTKDILLHPILERLDLEFIKNPFPFEYRINRVLYLKSSRVDELLSVISCMRE